MISKFAILLFFQMPLPREPGVFVRHFRQVIPSKGCRKQQPNWAGLSALDPEQGTSSLHPDKGLPPLTRAGSFTPGTPDNGHCIPLDPCPGKTEILRSCPQRILSVSPVFQCVRPANEQAFRLEKFQSASGHASRRKHGCPPAVPAPSHCKTGWLPAGNGASPLSIAAVHHRDGGTGCTRSRLTGKTKATSFRLSTTVGRLCFGHYDFFH